MEDDQRLNTLVHEGDALQFSIARSLKITVDWIFVLDCKKPENHCRLDICARLQEASKLHFKFQFWGACPQSP